MGILQHMSYNRQVATIFSVKLREDSLGGLV